MIESLLREIAGLKARTERLEAQDAASGKLTSWTPTVDQGGAVAVTVDYAKYVIVGKLVWINARLAVTGAGVAGNGVSVRTLPAATDSSFVSAGMTTGVGLIRDSSSGIHYHTELRYRPQNSPRDFAFYVDGNTTEWGVAPSIALASGDTILLVGSWHL